MSNEELKSVDAVDRFKVSVLKHALMIEGVAIQDQSLPAGVDNNNTMYMNYATALRLYEDLKSELDTDWDCECC